MKIHFIITKRNDLTLYIQIFIYFSGFYSIKQRGGIGRVGGREMQKGRDMGTYVYV